MPKSKLCRIPHIEQKSKTNTPGREMTQARPTPTPAGSGKPSKLMHKQRAERWTSARVISKTTQNLVQVGAFGRSRVSANIFVSVFSMLAYFQGGGRTT